MYLSLSRKDRNAILRRALSLITRDQGMSLSAIGEIVNTHKTSVAALFYEKDYANVKSETYIRYLHRLGCKLKFKTYTQKGNHFYSEVVYRGDMFDIKHWSIINMRNHLEHIRMTATEAARIIGITQPMIKTHLNLDKSKRTSVFSGMELFSKLGLTFVLEAERPEFDVRSIIGTSPIGPAAIPDAIIPTLITSTDSSTIDDVINFLSDREISEMMRGNVKTSLGEVIRPFL